MDRFDAMRAFTRVADRRSFTLAAQDLGLPRSSLTEAVKQLEARLGVQLLQRTTRHVSPTLDGEAYYRRCVALLADVEDAENAFACAKPKGHLHVDVHGTLARHFLLPRLPAFIASYPEITLYLSEGDRFVGLARERMDCALRVGELRDSDLIARRLTILDDVTCASPAYLARHGTPESVEALDGHRMVGFLSSASGALLPLEFTIAGAVRTITLPTTLTVNAGETYAAAARMGLGLIQAPRYRLEEDFARGALVPILTQFPPTPSPVSVVYPRSRKLAARVRVFIDWLVNEFAAESRS